MTRYRAIVIGSGAGGAPTAATLARTWGDGVALVEAGAYNRAKDFTQREREMLSKLYAQGGLQTTEDGAIGVVQGVGVGGSTVVNDALCFRPPPELEARWSALGAPIDLAALAPYVDEVERTLGVQQFPREMINRANYLVGLGAARLGWRGERLRHNSTGCQQCGFRHLGCAYNAKQSMNVTYVPRALESGAVLHAETRAHHLRQADGAWEVHTDRGTLMADHVVVCAGVVQTPALLLRSGIAAGEGVQVHVETPAWGDFSEPVDGFNGIPMSYGVLEFSDVYGHTGPGYLIEGVSTQPMAFSVQPQVQGPAHQEVLRRYRHLAGAVALVRSTARGRITLGPGGRAAIAYPLVAHDTVRIQHFFERITELFLASGAERVLLSHRDVSWTRKPPTDLAIEPQRVYVYTAHPFGGANRGAVTDAVGRVVGQPNLWVLDGSAIPEALGVNPQVTIAALALQGAERLLSETS